MPFRIPGSCIGQVYMYIVGPLPFPKGSPACWRVLISSHATPKLCWYLTLRWTLLHRAFWTCRFRATAALWLSQQTAVCSSSVPCVLHSLSCWAQMFIQQPIIWRWSGFIANSRLPWQLKMTGITRQLTFPSCSWATTLTWNLISAVLQQSLFSAPHSTFFSEFLDATEATLPPIFSEYTANLCQFFSRTRLMPPRLPLTWRVFESGLSHMQPSLPSSWSHETFLETELWLVLIAVCSRNNKNVLCTSYGTLNIELFWPVHSDQLNSPNCPISCMMWGRP